MWGNIGENIIATIAFPPTFSTGLVTRDHRGGGGGDHGEEPLASQN
jgi:hypothetical protein